MNSWVFRQAPEKVCQGIVDELAPAQAEEEMVWL
jgi:hypothetical protein